MFSAKAVMRETGLTQSFEVRGRVRTTERWKIAGGCRVSRANHLGP